MISGTIESLDVDGLRARVFRVGAGRPLVYLHSGFGEFGPLPVFSALADEGLAVWAPEIPGFGQSDEAQDWYHISDVAFTLRRILDELELERSVLVGSSLGGWLAAELAVWFPDRVESLVLVDAAGLRIEGAPVFDLFDAGQRETVARAFPHGFDVSSIFPTDTAEAARHSLRAMETVARIGWNPFLHDPALPRRLATIQAPTLVIWGADDGIVPPAHGEAYRAGIPLSRMTVVPRCGHLPALEQPEVTAGLIGDFVRSSFDRLDVVC